MQFEKVIKKLEQLLKKQCSKERYIHIQGVVETCVDLSKHFGVKKEDAIVLGLAHDMAREWPHKKLLKYAISAGYTPRKIELRKPVLLHGRCAAIMLREKYGVENTSILEAIEDHTVGRAGMDMHGILLYVSDYIEPSRKYISQKFKEQILRLSPWEMVRAVHKHAKKRNKKLSPLTRQLDVYARSMAKKT